MSSTTALKLLLVINPRWLHSNASTEKKIRVKNCLQLSGRHSRIEVGAQDVALKFRDSSGAVQLDTDAHVTVGDTNGDVLLHSHRLAADLLERKDRDEILFISFEQVHEVARVGIHFCPRTRLEAFNSERPDLRLSAYELPPTSVTEIEPASIDNSLSVDGIYDALCSFLETEDPVLFGAHTDQFLRTPHIVVPLLTHIASLSADDTLRFPVQIKRLADQFRLILTSSDSLVRIQKIERNHLETWANAQGKRYAFLDGGVARIAGLPGTEPTALRVGMYCVRPGDESLESRERWKLCPYIVGDIIDKDTGVRMNEWDQIDLRRLGEAARYILEPMTGLHYLATEPAIDMLFAQGPLINQFVMYDEGPPHFLPFLTHEFLASMGITREAVEGAVDDIPRNASGQRMWRQFMAIYGYIISRVNTLPVPFIGVVERSAGRWLAQTVLQAAVDAKIVKEAYQKKVMGLLSRLDISDDFLFGCVLQEGEYITPIVIPKNEPRRARDHWQPVVKKYPRPFATVLKTSEMTFPFRIEMNIAAKDREAEVLRLLYHTARLLPRYAFPVGLDIVDKYAKVPDWLSRNVSARLAATVLNKAMAEGDSRLVAQIRQLLAHTPRDFFYRPQI